MLREIVQSCCSGFGDCITGYVSTYLLKKQLERLYQIKEIKLSLQWNYMPCPYINKEHLFKGTSRGDKMAHVNCLFFGDDGTQAFRNFYKSRKMMTTMARKTHLCVTINQYIGRCLIDESTTRDEIKELTYEAYRYFWTSVIDHTLIPESVKASPAQGDFSLIYVRLGDQYLCEKKPDYVPLLTELYQYISKIDVIEPITLIGDIPNKSLIKEYKSMFGENHSFIELNESEGSIAHSLCQNDVKVWGKIFSDLFLILYSKQTIILSKWSNFTRIVLFLKDMSNQSVYFLDNGVISRVDDLSTIFAKHYVF